jgi:hypothetical protein
MRTDKLRDFDPTAVRFERDGRIVITKVTPAVERLVELIDRARRKSMDLRLE